MININLLGRTTRQRSGLVVVRRRGLSFRWGLPVAVLVGLVAVLYITSGGRVARFLRFGTDFVMGKVVGKSQPVSNPVVNPVPGSGSVPKSPPDKLPEAVPAYPTGGLPGASPALPPLPGSVQAPAPGKPDNVSMVFNCKVLGRRTVMDDDRVLIELPDKSRQWLAKGETVWPYAYLEEKGGYAVFVDLTSSARCIARLP